jgi:hypothetical protein
MATVMIKGLLVSGKPEEIKWIIDAYDREKQNVETRLHMLQKETRANMARSLRAYAKNK